MPFDYIVIGGGTAGLPVANRQALSENPNIKVGILEAGFLHDNDPLIDVPRNVAMNNGQPKYDWMFSTSAQPGAAGRCIPVVRGKLVGGSSALNYMGWDRGSKEEYDAWKLLGDADEGWDWDALLPFFTKIEDTAPASVSRDLAIEYSTSAAHVSSPGIPKEAAVGVGGPIKLSYNTVCADTVPAYIKAWNTLDHSTNSNPFGGDTRGAYSCSRSIDHESGKRITATSAYYIPVASRTNLKLLTGAHVTKILFKPELVEGNRVAIGVEFTVDSKVYSVYASKEIILSAGAIQTPQILELSGIGDSKLLARMGIQTLVDLPGVGENLHDHTFIHIQYQAKHGIRTFDEFRNNPEFTAAEQERYDKTGQGWMASIDSTAVFTSLSKIIDESALSAKIKETETAIAIEKNQGSLNELAGAQLSIQLDWLKHATVPQLEFILFSRGLVNPEPGESYFVMSAGLQQPFSRGSVHIQSADPFQPPLIDPRYLTHDFDIFAHLAGYRAIEKLAQTPPLAEIITKQTMPPPNLSDEDVLQFRQALISQMGFFRHLVLTIWAPLRWLVGSSEVRLHVCKWNHYREAHIHIFAGVVGSNLKVHGTANLRVADASIIPMAVAAHIQSTVYAIGEKAADLIKSEYNGGNV
ncbi:alcohol oxidase [Mycena latifolia]|nr:alcohol oxidase [Mycena latifolia]